MTVLVADGLRVYAAWKRLPPELRAAVRAKRNHPGIFLTPLSPLGEAWVIEQVRRFGECERRRGAWRVSKAHSLKKGIHQEET